MASIIDNSVLFHLPHIHYKWHRIEKQKPLTGDVKWDGVAFLVKKKSVIPVLVELSGGIDHNSGTEKAQDDEEKMIRQSIKLLKIKKAEGSDLLHQYYIRHHGKILISIYT